METSVYIHIPFCASKCIYCDFLSFAIGDDLLIRGEPCPSTALSPDAYVSALTRELALRGQELQQSQAVVSTLYIGGGTPTILRSEELDRLLLACRQYLPLSAPEWTVEANPGTLTEKTIGVLVKAGVNRISLGIQDLCDERLALLGRRHNAAQARQAFMMCKDSFHAVSVDIMTALPGQRKNDMLETLETVTGWGPHHVSVYGLKVEADTPLEKLAASGEIRLPGEEEMLAMFLESRRFLVESGYEHYEIANFAKEGYRCRHNLTYWQNRPYLGLGLGAHSYWNKERLVNTIEPKTYLTQLNMGRLPTAERHPVSQEQEMEDTMMLGLRLREGVSYEDFQSRFGRDLRDVFAPQISRLQKLGVIDCGSSAIRLAPAGLPVANFIFAEFLCL